MITLGIPLVVGIVILAGLCAVVVVGATLLTMHDQAEMRVRGRSLYAGDTDGKDAGGPL